VKYGNDLELTEQGRLLTNLLADLNACLRDGHLDTAFKYLLLMDDASQRLQERLNRIRWP
jgi:hypothetical protein